MPPPPPPPPPPRPRGNVGQFRPPPPPAPRGPASSSDRMRPPPSSSGQQARSGISMTPPPPPSSAPASFSTAGQPRFAPPPPPNQSRANVNQFNPSVRPPMPQQQTQHGMLKGSSMPPQRGIPPPMSQAAPPPNYGGGMGMPVLNSRQAPPPPMQNSTPYMTPPPPSSGPPAYNGYGQQQQQQQHPPPPGPPVGHNAAYGQQQPPHMNQHQQTMPQGYPSPAPQYGHHHQEPAMDVPSEIPPPTMPHGIIKEAFYPKASLLRSNSTSIPPPPPANSRFVVLDDGNASPQLLRSTLYAIPHERSVLQKVLGSSAGNSSTYHNDKVELLATPMAVPSAPAPTFVHSSQAPLPEELRLTQIAVDGTIDKTKPPRCRYCNTYVNPFWENSKCNFCNRKSTVQDSALASQLGTVEYPVAGPYITRTPPVQPVFLYALDATAPSVQKYMELLEQKVFPELLEHAKEQQQYVTSKPKVRVGIVFCLASGVYIPTGFGGEQDQGGEDLAGFTVMPDIHDDPYSPLPLEAWTYDIVGQSDALQTMCSTLLEILLPRLIQERVRVHNTIGNSKDQPVYQLSCGGAAMAFMVDAMKETGGRATWISWRRPNCGVGKLMDRERSKLIKPAHKPVDDPFYKALKEKCQDYKVAMDIVLHSNPAVPKAFLDVATLGQVCAGSNGKLIRINAPTWQETFVGELLQRITSPSGWDCVFKVRTSTGVRVHSLVTNDVGKLVNPSSITDDSPDLELAVVQADTGIGVKLEHRVGGIPKQRTFVYVQTALLYTNAWTGERKFRVSTLGLRTCETPDAAFGSMDFSTLAACELRRAAQNCLQVDQDLKSTRYLVYSRMVAILADYRKSQQQMLQSNQLVLPEKLRLYPLLVMAMLKSPLLREGISRKNQVPNPLADERAHFIQEARRVLPAMAFYMVHPLLFQVPNDPNALQWSTYSSSDGTLLSELRHAPHVPLENPRSPTISCLEDDQVYLMDTGLVLYVILERNVSQQRIQLLDSDDDPLGRMIAQLRNGTPKPVIFIHAQNDKTNYHNMLKWMVADASASEPDTRGFYKRLHSKISETI